MFKRSLPMAKQVPPMRHLFYSGKSKVTSRLALLGEAKGFPDFWAPLRITPIMAIRIERTQ